MATNLPYMASPGVLPKILNKICEAAVPESFNPDFLGTKLGFPGGNQKSFISWAKKCGFINSDGTPTQLYKDFRNPHYRGSAMASALKKGYQEVYFRNEYAHELSRTEFVKIVSEITGLPHDNGTVKAIAATFFYAKEFANFEIKLDDINKEENIKENKERAVQEDSAKTVKKLSLGLNYTINLVLPKTDDPAVLNAIFKSLKENLLND